MRTRTKICGITNAADARAALDAGADALGFVFSELSPRCLTMDAAAAIIRELPPFLAKVGLFVDAPEDLVRRTIEATGIDTLQFHGQESPGFCRRFPLTVIKAFRVRDERTLEEMKAYPEPAWLLDAYVAGQLGGTGVTFNWDLAARAVLQHRTVILAGGLTPENAAEAVRQVRPYAVDVSSGVESAPGKKDHGRLRAFIEAVRAVSDG